MSIVSDLFQYETSVSVQFQEKTQTISEGALGPEVWSNYFTADGLFFVGGSVERIVGSRLAASVDAVVLIDYVAKTIPEGGRVKINDLYYSVVYPDNVAMQNELYVISLKRLNVV